MIERILLRLAVLARNPPSPRKALIVGCIVALTALVAGIDMLGWWPDWAQVEPRTRRRTILPQ
ncbi:hypothetical protein [Roseovarius sp. MMSF_3281]|uniref:hypothetical protein n=1 Tax=Roseovarius sp. MMSF_3281 TaxID=3046694 RepID=UPI00273E6381|nr:hypothetical protein [Roseovarius sp. MMSF_3281]